MTFCHRHQKDYASVMCPECYAEELEQHQWEEDLALWEEFDKKYSDPLDIQREGY